MQTESSSLFQIPDAIALLVMDTALAAVGVAVLIRAVLRYRRAGTGLLASAPLRPNKLWPEYIGIPILVFALMAMLLQGVLADLPEETLLAGMGDLLAGVGSQVLGAVVCLMLAARTFERRLAGFLFGDGKIADQVRLGFLGLLAALPVCFAAVFASLAVIIFLVPDFAPPEHEVLQLMVEPNAPGWVLPVLWLSAVVIAPFAEEVFFRGICQTALAHLFRRRWIPVLLVGLVFGFAHADQPQFVAPLVVLGLVLGYVYERSGSLVPAITLHALFNLKTMIFATIAT